NEDMFMHQCLTERGRIDGTVDGHHLARNVRNGWMHGALRRGSQYHSQREGGSEAGIQDGSLHNEFLLAAMDTQPRCLLGLTRAAMHYDQRCATAQVAEGRCD